MRPQDTVHPEHKKTSLKAGFSKIDRKLLLLFLYTAHPVHINIRF